MQPVYRDVRYRTRGFLMMQNYFYYYYYFFFALTTQTYVFILRFSVLNLYK